MSNYRESLEKEQNYLSQTLAVIRKELNITEKELADNKANMMEARKAMWENGGHSYANFTQITEANQYLMEVKAQTVGFENKEKRVKNYRQILNSPYFGRFDFTEESFAEQEKIYIGLFNVMDSAQRDIYVYDWRTPVAGMFYRYESGKAKYRISSGEVSGVIGLKRQYKIKQGELEYFFDCSITINDELLQDVLSRNTSTKMRNIVETIQQEQDKIIRDTESELLMVQGVAGSGKTSVALHRIAFLLYQGMGAGLKSEDIVILSPNVIFSRYISNVLPELGEENVPQFTFDEIGERVLGTVQACQEMELEMRANQLERLTLHQHDRQGILMRNMIEFKGSEAYLTLLERFLHYVEHRLIDFQDVYYHNRILATREELKSLFLHDEVGMPIGKRLNRIERRIMESSHPLQKERLNRIEKIVQHSEGHDLEIKSFSRLLAIKETKKLSDQVRHFTRIDSFSLYILLLSSPRLWEKIAAGVPIPQQWEEMAALTLEKIKQGLIPYEDIPALLYLEMRVEGIHHFAHIRHVIIDEAQDYFPLYYELFKQLFRNARFTVLGDVGQAVEREIGSDFYDRVANTLHKEKSQMLTLSKSYRSSLEINAFAGRFLNQYQSVIPFERHEGEPQIIYRPTEHEQEDKIIADVRAFQADGWDTIAILCKTQREAQWLFDVLKESLPLKLLHRQGDGLEKGIVILPIYLAKGLEFDAVLVYDVSKDNYFGELDRKLLYIASTRALHRLNLYYTGEKSPLL